MVGSRFLAPLAFAAVGTSCALSFTDYPPGQSSTGVGASTSGTTTKGTSVGMSSASSGSVSSTSNGASASTGSGPTKIGVVIASEDTQASSGQAVFGKDATAFTPTCLGLIPVGACEKYACSGSNATASAGAITIKTSAGTLALMPDASGSYAEQQVAVPLWQPGESVLIRAQGADVPMFQLSVDAPAVPTITSPASTSPLTIHRSAGLGIQWSGPSSGLMYVYLSAPNGASSTVVECVFDGASGMAAVPASVLSDFQAQQIGSLAIASLSQTTVVSGDWSVTAKLETVAYGNNCIFQ